MKHERMQKIGIERIYRLFEVAESEIKQHPERSRRYVDIARKISKRLRAKIPDELKTKFCKKCGAYLLEGYNAKIERAGTMSIVECKECGAKRKTGKKSRAGNL